MWFTTTIHFLTENRDHLFKTITESIFCPIGTYPEKKLRARYKHSELLHLEIREYDPEQKRVIQFWQ